MSALAQSRCGPVCPKPVADVDGDAALAGVHVEEKQAAVGIRLVIPEGRQVTRGIAAGGFDLDDVGAHVGEQLATVNALLVGKLQNAAPGKGGGVCSLHVHRASGQRITFGRWLLFFQPSNRRESRT
jgi:hypothetical protein